MGTKTVTIWEKKYMFVLTVHFVLSILEICNGHDYPNQTQLTLCQAQCEALCLDKVPNCEKQCNNGPSHWITNCNSPNCSGTCSVFLDNFRLHQHLLEPVPTLSIYQSEDRAIELSWTPQSLPSNYTTIYIIEETRSDPHYSNINTVSTKGWVRGNKFQVSVDEVCNVGLYRVMAINEFGSLGYSLPVKLPGLKPGLVQMIHYVGRGIYFNKDADPTLSKFMAILEWDAPSGWHDDDIYKYEWNPAVKRYCNDVSHDSLPVFTPMINQTKRILMTIGGHSVGCSFTIEVRAISKCHVYGPWTAFTVKLTNCRDIVGYKCQPEAFDPPGLVNNVSLSISSTPYSALLQIFNSNTLSPDIRSPLLINLHIHWRPPSDIGSQGIIDHYIIRSGKAKREPFPIPPAFIEEPTVRNANSNIVELIFELPTRSIPYTFGVQIVAVAPGQIITDNQWGMFPMYTLQMGRNGSIGQLASEGKILLDKAGIVIVYVNNTLPVHFLLDEPDGRSSNVSINRVALQWGPLVGPNAFEVENQTILPLNQTVLRVFLQHPSRSYGIQKLLLLEDYDEPSDTEWDEAPVFAFTLPDYQDNSSITAPFNFVPVYIISGCVVSIGVVTFILLRLHKRHRFKNLERRLIDPDDHDVDENNDHYFVMRTTDQSAFRAADVPTVVPDRWELPHCCLKIGRVLGSGAFGQVVKGRVSRSILLHRGIDLHGKPRENHTHVTVAIKMLQESCNESCSRDFLNEIQLMKDIGYHRNIVSILGCCTLREPYCLVVEHVPHGDLLTYLRKIREKVQLREEEGGHYINHTVDLFSPHDLLAVARQVSVGMEYLSQKGFVHRDLAARNILIGSNKNVKIGDFGLARYIYDNINKVYVNRRGGKLPLRWMSPESIFDLIFSTASDVWSFGILLYEIVTLGGNPYPTLSNSELIKELKTGYKMERPDNCANELYEIMTRCWTYDPNERPNFTELCNMFTTMLERDAELEYFDFQIDDQARIYYQIKSDEMDFDFNEEVNAVALFNDTKISEDTCSVLTTNVEVHQPSTSVSNIDSACVENINGEDNHSNATCKTTYSDAAFMKRNSTFSSINNKLYSVVQADDAPKTITRSTADNLETDGPFSNKSSDEATEDLIALTRLRQPVHRTSGSSDEVFTDCPGCVHLRPDGQCINCGFRNVSILTPVEADREDSGFGSTNSDDSNRNCFTDNDSDSSSSVRSGEDFSIADTDIHLAVNHDKPESSVYSQARLEVSMEDENDINFPDLPAILDSYYLSLSSRIYEEDGTWIISTTHV